MGALIVVSALTALACLLLLYACCKVAAWADRRSYRPVIDPEGPISGNTDAAPSGATSPDAPSCPRCQTERPFGPGSIEFEDEGSDLYYQCRRCGHLYFGRDTAPGRCWGAGA